jgi:hypothetical protein
MSEAEKRQLPFRPVDLKATVVISTKVPKRLRQA